MPHVTVTINGRAYRLACDDGEEQRLESLGQAVENRVQQIKASVGEIGDTRLTVMAAIMIADEMSEMKKKIATFEATKAEQDQIRASLESRLARTEGDLATVLDATAERLEKLAGDMGREKRAEG